MLSCYTTLSQNNLLFLSLSLSLFYTHSHSLSLSNLLTILFFLYLLSLFTASLPKLIEIMSRNDLSAITPGIFGSSMHTMLPKNPKYNPSYKSGHFCEVSFLIFLFSLQLFQFLKFLKGFGNICDNLYNKSLEMLVGNASTNLKSRWVGL